MAYALRARFEREGFDVDVAGEGFAAITLLREQQYEAVLLDLIIHSGLNGFGVLNFLDLEQPETLDRVFLITGMPEQTVINTAPALLPRLFRKPFDDGVLVQAVRDLSRRESDDDGTEVLVVEDDKAVSTLLQAAVESIGYTTTVARDGRAAVDAMARHDYRAVLLDLVVPGIDGFGILDYVGRMRAPLLRRIIVITGLPLPYRQRLEMYEIGGVLEKPVDVSELRELIEQCVGK